MLNSKEFDNNLNIDKFSELESYYQQTKKHFEQLTDKIKSDEVALKFPAFCYLKEYLMIKFPTFKIRFINSKLNHDEINKILKDSGNFKIYAECNIITIPSLKPVHSIAIHCLEDNLSKNEKLASEIQSKLEKEGIYSEKCVTSGYYSIPIVIDKEGYIAGIRN